VFTGCGLDRFSAKASFQHRDTEARRKQQQPQPPNQGKEQNQRQRQQQSKGLYFPAPLVGNRVEPAVPNGTGDGFEPGTHHLTLADARVCVVGYCRSVLRTHVHPDLELRPSALSPGLRPSTFDYFTTLKGVLPRLSEKVRCERAHPPASTAQRWGH
jgi:hypothetical protein